MIPFSLCSCFSRFSMKWARTICSWSYSRQNASSCSFSPSLYSVPARTMTQRVARLSCNQNSFRRPIGKACGSSGLTFVNSSLISASCFCNFSEIRSCYSRKFSPKRYLFIVYSVIDSEARWNGYFKKLAPFLRCMCIYSMYTM